jgi:hypothetical protein
VRSLLGRAKVDPQQRLGAVQRLRARSTGV